jgi:site-specific DNA-methyltransferase (adenine-specific)
VSSKGVRTNKGGNGQGGGESVAINFDVMSDWAVVPELLRVSDRWVICFCTMMMLPEYERAAGKMWIRDGIWHRTNSAPQMTGDRPAQGCEGIAIMHRAGRKRWNGGGHQAFWDGPIELPERRIHETQKPEWLMTKLIEQFTDPDDLIFDPTAGGATTGVACLRTGRRFIGCEIRPEAHVLGLARLEAVAKGGVYGKRERGGQGSLMDLMVSK